jgi:ubiquinone/menaquinone biosynthesis C-methylase UbiE
MSVRKLSEPAAGDRWFTSQGLRNVLHSRIEVPLLVRLLRLPAGCDVLETGCGAGIGLMALADNRRPVSLTGVDIDEELLHQARARFSARGLAANLVHGDIRELPFPDESFDLVVDFGTLFYIRFPRRALREVARVLRAGGVLVHETPLSQLLAHPRGSSRRLLPWRAVPELQPLRSAGLWACRVKHAGYVEADGI